MDLRTAIAAAALAASCLATPAQAEGARHRFVTIGTGSPAGVYYAAGVAICEAVNRFAKRREAEGAEVVTSCRAGPSGGSAFNIRQVLTGAFTFVIAQANVQQLAYAGGDPPWVVAAPDLRALFSLHREALQIAVAKDVEARSFEDLAGLRVSPGNPGSGSRITANGLADAYRMDADDFGAVELLTLEAQADALCAGDIDAFAIVAAVPSEGVEAAARRCGAHLLPLNGDVEREMIRQAALLSAATVPAGAYATTDAPVPTLGVRAGLATRAAVPDAVVRDVVAAVMEDLPRLRAVHPALADLEPRRMATEGLGAPLHDGAAAFYAERGWR